MKAIQNWYFWANNVQKGLQILRGLFYKLALKFLFHIFFTSYPMFYLYSTITQDLSRQYFLE